ncbi:hypothetical protein LTR16_002353 [Cryomyces antarcticus]|uniref:Uncharacterized protein n=1 Tax=Cryomyces antarcticus TaxID=329879 RepID=A0ABR0M0E3_9PEZI|nr:hypothetical protein LTR16_002353 [Cryomyces antarcticus]
MTIGGHSKSGFVADMPPSRPHLYATLPRNFTFHYADGQGPRTPEPEDSHLSEPREPQAPRPQTYRVRRRRIKSLANDQEEDYSFLQSSTQPATPLPTIEGPELSSDLETSLPGLLTEPVDGFLAPNHSTYSSMSTPRTPLAQISTSFDDLPSEEREWDLINSNKSYGYKSNRPVSVCSGYSDSSASSFGTSGSFPSLGESCTSPESNAADPFVFPTMKSDVAMLSSPQQAYQHQPYKRLKLTRHHKWTVEQDDHLWLTYMIYLQDPTMTPFKMLPGTTPPLGICHRVAREAKRNWKGRRAEELARSTQPGSSPDILRPVKSNSSTPTGGEVRRSFPKWPRSEAATRRRLRELCKRKPSLSAHYQRLLHTRTPSPFQSSSSPKSRSSDLASPLVTSDSPSAFSTRDMNVSLATSTAASMQIDGPLHQMTSKAMRYQRQREPDWFRRIGRSSGRAHQKSQSLQYGSNEGVTPWPSDLASPSDSALQVQDYYGAAKSSTCVAAHETIHETPSESTLESPMHTHAPLPFKRSLKRRHKLEDEGNANDVLPEIRQNLLQELFGAPAESSHRRVRSRGFSLSDMGGARRLSSVFTSPTAFDQADDDPFTDGVNLLPPTFAPPRLGSPFGGSSSNVHFNNTFPRNFSPRGFESSASFEQRLGSLGSNNKPTQH